MSYAQASALRAHLQTLTDAGADITAFPDAAELMTTWGATHYDLANLVGIVRENCPAGYIVPFVCKHTDMRLIMARGQGNLFTAALMGVMMDIKYCRTRLTRISRNLRNLAVGFPMGSAFRTQATDLADLLSGLTNSVGPVTSAITNLPILARRAAAAERTLLRELAEQYAA